MSDKFSKKQSMDDFWDIAKLVPQKDRNFVYANVSTPAEISVDMSANSEKNVGATDDTVIKRYVHPYGEGERLTLNDSFDIVDSYTPECSLIHNVTLKKWRTNYNYYGSFYKDAISYMDVVGEKCEYVPFYSFVPQYDQMDSRQLKYYFWFRENERKGVHIKTDSCYLLLYIYELLNLGEKLDVNETVYILAELWNEYHETFSMISNKLGTWICDFCLLHRLTPPENIKGSIVRNVTSLKEFFVDLPISDLTVCATSLLKYCSSYDFRTSKFVNEENFDFFKKHILGALAVAIRHYSDNSKIFSKLASDDCRIERDIYAGGICVADQKYRIEVSYCSFSRSNELRFLVGDIVKYSENKLRAYLGIKSRMTVYSVSVELRNEIDEYFFRELPAKRRPKAISEKKEYDILYDTPIKKLSLSDAAKIEAESWETTKELISAFEETWIEVEIDSVVVDETGVATSEVTENVKELNEPNDIWQSFKEYTQGLKNLINGDERAIDDIARQMGKMPDAVVDEINTIAYDVVGDAIIEDDGMGNYTFIDDYRELFE